MIPESHISRFALLKKMSCLQCLISVCLVLFGLATCARINLFQLADCKWCFFRIFSCIRIIKVDKLWFSVSQFCDDKSHLQTPVSKMYITDHFMTYKTADSFNTFSDDCRAEMTYMERFCNVWSAVINDNCLWLFCCRYGKFLICCHFF